MVIFQGGEKNPVILQIFNVNIKFLDKFTGYTQNSCSQKLKKIFGCPMRVPDEGYSRNALCTLNLIPMFLFLQMIYVVNKFVCNLLLLRDYILLVVFILLFLVDIHDGILLFYFIFFADIDDIGI